jgi:putative tributyrin esterase
VKKSFLYFLLLLSIHAFGQKTNHGYNIEAPDYSYGKVKTVTSASMKRNFPALIFTPAGYDTAKQAFPVVYMLHGTTDLPLSEEGLRTMYNPATRIQEMANLFNVIIVAPITGISYYLDSPIKKGHLFATYISQELTAFMDKNYKTIANRQGRILCGFSMGGYGAASLLCRYPDVFSIALCRSGVLNLATNITDLDWDEIGDEINSLLGDYYTNGENYHLNSCFNLVNHIRDRKDIAFVIEVGKDDFLYKTNWAFHERLKELGVPHIYGEYPGGHVWNANTLRSLLSHLQYFNPTQFKN